MAKVFAVGVRKNIPFVLEQKMRHIDGKFESIRLITACKNDGSKIIPMRIGYGKRSQTLSIQLPVCKGCAIVMATVYEIGGGRLRRIARVYEITYVSVAEKNATCELVGEYDDVTCDSCKFSECVNACFDFAEDYDETVYNRAIYCDSKNYIRNLSIRNRRKQNGCGD